MGKVCAIARDEARWVTLEQWVSAQTVHEAPRGAPEEIETPAPTERGMPGAGGEVRPAA